MIRTTLALAALSALIGQAPAFAATTVNVPETATLHSGPASTLLLPATIVKGTLIPPAGKSFVCSATTALVQGSNGLKLNVPTTQGVGGACNFTAEVHVARGIALTSCAGVVKIGDAQELNFDKSTMSGKLEALGKFNGEVNQLGAANPGSTINTQIHVTGEP